MHWKISSGKRGTSGRTGAHLALPFMSVFCSLWAGDVCGCSDRNVGWSPSTKQLSRGLGLLGTAASFFLPENLCALDMTPCWHSCLFSKLPFPYLFHLSSAKHIQGTLQEIDIHNKNRKKKMLLKSTWVAEYFNVWVPKLSGYSVMGWIWYWTLTWMKTAIY